MKSSDRKNSRGLGRNLAEAAALASLLFVALSAPAPAQVPAQPGRASDSKPTESRPPVAQYDIGHIVKRLAALEAQVAELKKRNDMLASEINQMKVKDALASKIMGSGAPGVPSVHDRLKKLEQAMAGHTHHMPAIGSMALNTLPGMQDIANKAGVGHVLQQWKDIKLHVTFGSGGAPGQTGTPVQ